MATKKTTTQSKSKQQAEEANAGDKVLWSTVLFALGVLTLAFTVIKGESAWNSIHNIFLGMFGFSVFLVPAILIYVSIMIAMDKSQRAVQGKVIQCFVIILLSSAFIQIVTSGQLTGTNLFEEIIPALFAEGKQLRGGGVMSIFIAGPLLALFKRTGATIIIVLLIFVVIMIFSNKTIVDLVNMFKNAVSAANEARGEYTPTEASDFIAPPGAKKTKADKLAEKKAAKAVPNSDVPPAVVKEKSKNFNVDIPIPNNKKAEEQLAEQPKTEQEIFMESMPAHPVSAPSKEQSVSSVEATETIAKATNELDDIIKKAATAPEKKKGLFAPKVEKPETEKAKKQSTLASNKIQTEEELDMPDAPTAADIQNEIAEQEPVAVTYQFPPISLLKNVDNSLNSAEAEAEMKSNADTLVETLKSFGVSTRIVDIHRGPTVTRYELQPSAGVKISKITGLADDIALNLAAAGVRIEAPIPGKAAVGVEVPNRVKDIVTIREMIESPEFTENKSKLSFVVGKNIDGEIMIGDIGKMPHMIIAGTTGSGKSVCTNSIIMSILYNATPDEVRLVLIDPKMVEFKVYDGIPHLLIPVVTDPRKAAGALSLAVQEMLKRYKLFADYNVR
ncbi:MAG: DNA translocase FtsK, partial [Oscillospiraceae bacterium]|nr:DNA translocase FtsK [Oscillospiraceae bacterium]